MCSAGSTPQGMFDVQNIYGTPQVPRKKPCLRPRRMTLIDLRNVPLSEDEAPQRKASSGTVRSEGGLSQYSKTGIWHIHDSTDSLPSSHRGSMRSKHASESSQESIRFPKLEDCAHFHYDFVDFGQLQVNLCDDDRENYRHNEVEQGEAALLVRVSVNDKGWTVRRSLSHFASLDRQLHRCIFDRKFSQLPDLQATNTDVKNSQEVEQLLHGYLKRFSELAGTMINCGSILNWLEMDNRGNRLLAVDDSGINTPAIAAAHAIKRYTAQAADEISLQVGDIVSVIDMPPAEDTIWWRGKRGFEVGFFPSACVEVIIGDKVPSSMATVMPVTGSLSTSIHGGTLTPLSTPAVTRKPCEVDEETASMLRKHGKLMSVLRTFFTNRPPRNQLKQSGIVKERVFGCDLGEHLLNSGHDVPVVLKSCAEVIERYGIVDGIYRLSGITSNIQKLRVAFDEDEVPELFEATYLQDIHSISSLLKMYFRELPNPLLTYQLYDKFAEAVRDEDNKLLRIHDVVQQLPPPHYRTLEYLMRHLGRVASHALETGMHSKNLAIVWAPNLLRSKELELGGGAAALQGVGIQAVVTECLICYCDLIFNDKMPSYNSPHLHKSQKKPRPKSLAISTPTRLLSLEEARERAFLTSLAHSQRFIDVGGGPSSLPANYHTVIDLPGYRKKAGKASNKGKKSPVSGGWKSIFSKPRSGSIKKPRKGSMQGDEKPLESLKAKALTEEDVHNWKHRLRSAKSAESLLSMATSARSSICSQTSSSMGFSEGAKKVPIVPSGGHPPRGANRQQQDPSYYKQSFVRGDSTRKPLHRRTPSAPSTPRQDRHQYSSGATTTTSSSAHSSPSKASSQPQLDSLSASPNSDSSLLTPPSDSSLGIDIDAAIKARLQQMAMQSRGGMVYSPRSPEKVPLESGGGHRGEVEKVLVEGRNGVVEFSSSASPPTTTITASASRQEQKNNNGPTAERTKFFVSRYHDYAEIVSDEDRDEEEERGRGVRSPTDMQEVMDKWDSKLSSTAQFYLHDNNEDHSEPEAKHAKLDNEKGRGEGTGQVVHRHRERVPHSNAGTDSPPSTQVVRRRVEVMPSESADLNRNAQFPEGPADSARPPIPSRSQQRQLAQHILGSLQKGNMSKCLSVPSDIAQSLENITASQSDLLSSMTLSELSQSVNSFGGTGTGTAQDESPVREDPRWRRSTSLDSLEGESTLGRTLRDINAQIDTAFHQKVERAIQLEEEGYSRHGDSDSSSLTPLHISEDNLSSHGTGPDASASERQQDDYLSDTSTTLGEAVTPVQSSGPEVFPRSVSDSRSLGADSREPPMSQSYPVPGHHPAEVLKAKPDGGYSSHPDYPDYAIIRKRQKTSKEDRGPGFYSGQGILEDTLPEGASPVSGGGGSPPAAMQSFLIGNLPSDSSPWPQGGEAFADSVPMMPPSPRRRFINAPPPARQEPDPMWHARNPGSDMGMGKPEVGSPRSKLGDGRFDSNISNAAIHHHPLSQSELSAGVCMVKRQEKSSSSSCSSSSSSDVDDNSDDSIEIVHCLEPVGAQFAMKLNRKQKTTTANSPSQSSPRSDSSGSLRIVERTSASVPENKLLSSQDMHWKQSPLFGKGEEGGESRRGGNVKLQHGDQVNMTERDEGFGAIRTDRYGYSEESSRTFPPHYHTGEAYSSRQAASSGGGGGGGRGGQPGDSPHRRLSQSSDYSRDPSSPRHTGGYSGAGGRPRAASQSDSALKFQREDLPIISGNLPTSPPTSQRSHIPSPRSPTVCSPPTHSPAPSQHSRLPSPRSPVVPSSLGSSNPSSSPHLPQGVRSPSLSSPPHKSRLPSLHSPGQPSPSSQHSASPKSVHSTPPPLPTSPSHSQASSESPSSASSSSGSVPLHLMLYHPDEFQVPPAAVGVTTSSEASSSSPSLPQVYVKSDTVTEEKAVIRKGGSGGGGCRTAGEVAPSPVSASQCWSSGDTAPSSSSSSPRVTWKTLAGAGGAPESCMQLGKAEQDSMEVDNLCNRLVDELHAVRAQPISSRDLEVAQVTTTTATPSRGSVQVEAVVERRVEESEVGGEAVVEERLLRVESFGEVQEEEVENALNTGKELLLSHSASPLLLTSSSSSSTPTTTSTTTSTTTTTTTLLSTSSSQPPLARPSHERRPSASKIPRFHKRTDSREDKPFVSEEDVAPLSPYHRRTSSQEDRNNASSDLCSGEATHSPRVQKQSSSREERTVVSDVTQGKVSHYSRYHRNSREEKTVISEVGGGGQPPRGGHRRTGSQEDKHVSGDNHHDLSHHHPRYQRRANSREEKNAVSEGTSENTSSSTPRTSAPNRSRGPDRNKTGTNSRSKDSNDQNKSVSGRTSKIPLSQKMPSPTTTSSREPKMSKIMTSPSSPRQATVPPAGKSQNQNKSQPSPMPRTRMSLPKSENVPPPSEEVMEVSRPSVKKRTAIGQKGERKTVAPVAAVKESKSEKEVIVQELKMEKGGDAKLVIEKQPNLKKKIQTVHARKVPHPTRQIAEALDMDTCDSSPAELSSTGPSDMEHSGMSSQEDEVFSDENMYLRAAGGGRDRSYSSGMGMESPRSPRQPLFLSPLLNQKSESYHQMAASRSSLDDSALQLAAERQDDLLISLEGAGGRGGYYTGSLRTRRSQKMRHLMEMFERVGGGGSSEESGDTKKRERSGSTSGSTTLSAGSQEKELDAADDDDMFQPPSPLLLPASNPARRSRSRERGGGGGGGGRMTSPHKHPSQSPSRRYGAARGEEPLRRRRPSPANNRNSSNTEEKPRGGPNRTESGGGVGFGGRPPRYRSASRGRIYSDSSTSESDNTQFDAKRSAVEFSSPRPRGVPRGGGSSSRQEDTPSSGEKSEGSSRESGGDQDEEYGQRRGSIKELRQLFEKSPKDESRDSGNELSPPVPARRFVRTRSMSPAAESSSPSVTPNIMRRSMEIPPSSAMVKQPLRLGPKPFYGSKK
ncbi:uncharacterized protein LOC143291666 isoform X2 [Babylonia areolata]|uniref:uncharacterized protein LOC143291666 isoform X2 n=1 Tax=Babylonia areolata TaxID=304850 RepID=UPI003FD3CA77